MVDVRGIDPRFAPSSRLSAVRFLAYTGAEIKKISCRKITNPNIFDSLLNPNLGGLYDPALGPSDKHDLCGTCGLNYVHCPGHMGHIPLPLPVYHPIFFMTLYQVLRSSCLCCSRLLCIPFKAHLLRGQLELADYGLLSDAMAMEATVIGEGDRETDSSVQGISRYVEKCKRLVATTLEPSQSKTKNLVEFKRLLIADFLKVCTTHKKCPHCSAPVRGVRQENRARVFLKGLSKKHSNAWVAVRNKEMARIRQHGMEGGEDESTKQTNLGSLGLDIEGVDSDKTGFVTADECLKQCYLTPLEVRRHVRQLWTSECMLMDSIFGCTHQATGQCSPADMFFLDVVPVPPSRFRPISQMGEKRFENPQTANLNKVLEDSIAIHELMVERQQQEQGAREQGETPKRTLSFSERLQLAWVKMQTDVNCFMDSSTSKMRDVPNGIKQILEKKEGLFRKHMMGKRVDYAARSVISPDPYINMDEIGIPLVFASRLTYPQPVTHWNVKELRQAVINGPNVHPGATHVQNEDGSVVLLSPRNPRQRSAIAKRLLTPSKDSPREGAGKKVYRHLKNGDVLLLNRQPTLHKPSIMAHKARVLPGEKTLRLHYANCKCYNADFDGDEMNAHFPQNELARAEAYNIVSTHHQYLVPKDGTPLSGLIQDHVVSGLLMTIRGRMFNRNDYFQLVFSALPNFLGYFKTLPPCIWKPQTLWSGKQVVSTVLLNIVPEGQDKLNLNSKAKIAVKEWSRGAVQARDGKNKKKKKKKKKKYSDEIMTESEVVFRQGELLCGVLDKSQFGASQFGFVHSCNELYGGAVANLLLSALGRLFTTFLQLHGFTLGVEDILVTPEADAERKRLIAEGRQSGPEAAAEAFGISDPTDKEQILTKYEEAHRRRDGTGVKILDFYIKKKTDHYNNVMNTACVPAGLHKPFPRNCLQLMVQSGAKGSTVNCMQISCLLGQIELEGQRPPLMTSGRFLPSFLPYDTSPRAGGFVDGRFLTGIRPQEYFFHCMAGREGLVDTAVKTSRSGYLQRCLIKHLEGICVSYDLTVRDHDGSVVQFLYGEDGMDISKTSFLKEKQFPFLIDNHQAILYKLDPNSAAKYLETSLAPKHQKKLDRWVRKHGSPSRQLHPRRTGFLDFYEKHCPEMMERFPEAKPNPLYNYRTKAQLELIDMWYGMSPMARESWRKKHPHCPDPIIAQLSPEHHFGSISEKLTQQINSFATHNHGNMLSYDEENSSDSKLSSEKFQSLVQFKCLRALADPGEAVGLLSAQSIGEPSTQMTLNTFHFAGRGEMNVTLGIPRLREILMTASASIKTPAMDVPLLPHPQAREKGERLKKLFTRVCLSEVLEKVEVWEKIGREGRGHRFRLYRVKFIFLPERYYSEDFAVTPSHILYYFERKFVKKLVSAINKEIKLIKERRLKSTTVEREPQSGSFGHQQDREEGEKGKDDAQLEAPPDEDEDDDELSDMDEGDVDAGAAKQLSKKQQHSSYEGPDESDEEVMNAQRDESEDESSDAEDAGREVAMESEEEEGEEESPGEAMSANKTTLNLDRVRDVIQSSVAVVDYCYDPTEEQWCQLTLKFPSVDAKVMVTSVVEKLAPKSIVWETPHIKKGFLSESTESGEEGLWRLKTDGVNLQELWQHPDVLELEKVYTNDIHAMANTYGIEAASKAIIKEISGVFRVYGIAVDYRHLSLIADYMTFEGSYKAFNRIGIEANSSPFQKMSFETTMHFLKNATISGDIDALKSPSACLVVGRVVHGGTGCFELLQTLR